MLSGKSHDKYHAHETKAVSRKIVMAVGGALVLASVVVVVFLVANRTPAALAPAMPPPRPISLSEAKRFSNCSDWDGVVDAVRGVAEGQGYLHAFEYERLHPCCLVRSTGIDKTDAPLSTADIVFVVMTSAKTPQKAKGVLDTWGVGLEHLLMISATADGELPARTITPDRVAAEAGKPNPSTTAPAAAASAGAGNSGAASSAGSGGSGGGVSGGLSASALRQALMDEQHTPIWGVKYVSASPAYSHLVETKKWFVLADDDTWVNIPALLDTAARYDYRCPVTFGYVWSKLLWGGGAHGGTGSGGSGSGSGAGDAREQTDYHSGGAGLLLSREAFARIAPSFYTPACPFHHYNDITFGRCAWARGVQLVHSRGFYYDPPERSKDRHETVWLPPVAEAITYHYVQPVDMQLMTQYVNQRWQYEPSRRHANTSGTFLSVSHALLRNTDWEAIARQAKQPHGSP